MNTRGLRYFPLLTFVFAALLLAPIRAAADDDDPPGRVARLSYSRGEVSFSPAGTDDWVSAVPNRPITTGDKLWTDRNARAELHVGSATLYLSGETGFSFLNLDDRIMQVRLTEGTLNLHVRRLRQDESIEIDTPNLAFSVLRPGHYRLNVNDAGDTTVVNVRDGDGEVTGGGSAYAIHAGEQGYFTGTDFLNADMQPMPGEDDFDRWANDRDLREQHAAARRYVSDDVIGYEDLDDYGGWRSVPEYGTVWFPHTSVVGWAPYRYGHWVWISPWGWTWVDDAPWGFAPFHYGRWVSVRGAWGWVPCPPRVVAVAYVRPVYAPALVAWVGGPHFAAGIAIGGGGWGAGVNVGWFPLGPREVFVPSYPVSRTYVNNVNISNTTVNQTVINNYYNTNVSNKNVTVNNNITNVKYVNQGVSGGVTATSGQTFTSARAVNSNLVAVNRREMESAPVSATSPAGAPPRQAVMGAGTPTNVHPPAALQTRQVVVKTPPPPPPLPFQQRQAAIQANQGRPISMNEARQLETQRVHNNVAPVRIAPPATVVPPRVNNTIPNNANRPGQQAQPNTVRPPNANTQQANPGNQPGNSPQLNPGNKPANTQQANPGNQPGNSPQLNPGNKPANTQQANPVNQPGNSPQLNPGNKPANTHAGERPPTSRPIGNPPTNVNPQLEQKHQEQNQQLQQKQDQERQKLEQKQYQQQQKLEQQKANEDRQRQAQQKQQQQLQQLEQKHDQQQQQLKQKQQVDHAHTELQPKAKPKPKQTEDKPQK